MRLTVRRRTALVIALVTTLALGALLAFDRLVLVSGFQQFEDGEVRSDVNRVIRIIDAECRRVDVLISDWAQWDDAYEFMRTRSRTFVTSNLSPNILGDLDLAAIVFIDTDGKVVEARVALPGNKPGPIPELGTEARNDEAA